MVRIPPPGGGCPPRLGREDNAARHSENAPAPRVTASGVPLPGFLSLDPRTDPLALRVLLGRRPRATGRGWQIAALPACRIRRSEDAAGEVPRFRARAHLHRITASKAGRRRRRAACSSHRVRVRQVHRGAERAPARSARLLQRLRQPRRVQKRRDRAGGRGIEPTQSRAHGADLFASEGGVSHRRPCARFLSTSPPRGRPPVAPGCRAP
jgi:hypothetical protein